MRKSQVIEETTPHKKLRNKHAAKIEVIMADDDRQKEVNQDGGQVFKCVELKCRDLPGHAHCRRPYLVWWKE